MTNPLSEIHNPPIVEAIVDIDCDFEHGFDLASLETSARERFSPDYPKFQTRFVQEHKFEASAAHEPLKTSTTVGIDALQLLSENEKQLVQLRSGGFSFNRLAPYSTLDDYLPEIERTWRLFVGLVFPIQVRNIRLRYINRILVPLTAGEVDLDDFLRIGPRLPDDKLLLLGFLNQQTAVENDTGHEVNLVLASQRPESGRLPIILDITAAHSVTTEPADWDNIQQVIGSLRSLKNRIFDNTLTPKCIEMFR